MRYKRLLVWLLILLLVLTDALLLKHFENKRIVITSHELLFFPSGKFIRGIACGYDNFLADFLWIRCGIYYGDEKLRHGKMEYLYHIFNVISDLDPNFINVYFTGAMFLYDDLKNLGNALKLLDKGIYANPTVWFLPYIKGFLLYLSQNYEEAYKWFMVASIHEGKEGRAFKFANWCLQKEKGPEMALKFWENMYRTTKNKWMKEKAVQGIAKVIAYALIKYKRETGKRPSNIKELVMAGYLPYIPYLGGKMFRIKGDKILW